MSHLKGKSIRITADFSTETLNTKRAWNDVFPGLKDNNHQARSLIMPKLSFIIGGKI
jgi:hypothetical protein